MIIGGTTRLAIAVTNNNPTLALTALAFTDTYPAGLVNTANPAPGKTCANAATLTAAANGGTFRVANASVNAGATCTFDVNTTVMTSGTKTNTIPAGDVAGSYGGVNVASLADASAMIRVAPPLTVTKVSRAYFDPVNATTNPKLIPGGFVAYTVGVGNPGASAIDVDSVVVIDATPANLRLFVGDVPGTAGGPVQFQNGTPSSGLTYSYGGLASTTDDVAFSNDGGATWTYVPVPNANMIDPAVTHLRVRPRGSMAAGSSFTLLFGYLIN